MVVGGGPAKLGEPNSGAPTDDRGGTFVATDYRLMANIEAVWSRGII